MKIRTLEKDVYNYVNRNKFVTSNQLSNKFGTGNHGLNSIFIPAAVVCVEMSFELASAVDVLRNNASIYEIACGERFFKLVSGAYISKSLPVAKFERIHNQPEYHRYGYSGLWWLPVVYTNNEGVLWLLKALISPQPKIDKINIKTFNEIKEYINGDITMRYKVITLLSEMLSDRYFWQWDGRVKEMEQAIKEKYPKSKGEYQKTMQSVRKDLIKKHKL